MKNTVDNNFHRIRIFPVAAHCLCHARLQVAVSSRADVLRVMAQGAANRAVAQTKMNERSSRSHSVLTVIVDGRSGISGAASHGCLHLIDLAGAPLALSSAT